MKNPITRFCPSLEQEGFMIKAAIEQANLRCSNPEHVLRRALLDGCDYNNETFSVSFQALFRLIKSTMQFKSIKQKDTFTIRSLHLFLCRTIGVTRSFRREPAYQRRRDFFDRCVANKVDNMTSPIIASKPVTPKVVPVIQSGSVKDQVFNKLVSDHPELVSKFVTNHKQEFIDFCLSQ